MLLYLFQKTRKNVLLKEQQLIEILDINCKIINL